MPYALITATEYHARILKKKMPGVLICSWKRFCEEWLRERKIAVLSPLEERVIWHEIIHQQDFASPEAILTEAMDADHLMQLYGIPAEKAEHEIFKQFEARLPGDKTPFLRALKILQVATPPLKFKGKSLEFFGFVDLPPLYQKILENLNKQDVTVSYTMPQSSGKIPAKVYIAEYAEQEFLFALKQIEKQAQEHPQQTFALVVHQSALAWKCVHRLLKTYSSPLRINCSRGEIFADQPWFSFIRAVLQSLASDDFLVMSRVLTSPFWHEDRERRLVLDRKLRETMLITTFLPEVLRVLLALDTEIQDTAWFQTWARLATYDLDEILSGEEWASRLIWLDVCEEFKALPHLKTELSGKAFIALFLNSVAHCEVPGSTVENPNCHIVGVLEAAMLPVDSVWLLGADKDHYPSRKTQPLFLSPAVLVQYGVPVRLEEIYHYGHKLLAAICRDHEIHASFVGLERGKRKQLSHLLEARQVEYIENKQIPLSPVKVEAPLQNLPLVENHVHLVKGGAMLLKEQAECPFKAFAHYRLNLRTLESGRQILDPMQKGLIVHAVLERIWVKLKSQTALLALSEEERGTLIANQVDLTLAQITLSGRKKLIQKLERMRLIHLIRTWLDLEASRPAFAVSSTEVNELVTLGPLQFQIRLDRMDTLADGKKVVIDYKTGEVSSKSWFEERMREPQLPFYAITHAAEGALFACLKVGKMGLVGIVKDEDPNINWEEQRIKWKIQLEALAREYESGYLAVAPIDEKACLYCDLASFCRIKENRNF